MRSCHNMQEGALRAPVAESGVLDAADDLLIVVGGGGVLREILAPDEPDDWSELEARRRMARAAVQDWLEARDGDC